MSEQRIDRIADPELIAQYTEMAGRALASGQYDLWDRIMQDGEKHYRKRTQWFRFKRLIGRVANAFAAWDEDYLED